MYGIWAWHILHGVKWQMDIAELEALLRAAEKTAPPILKMKKRVPYTLESMLAVQGQLQLDLLCDAAVYSCLATTFYSVRCLGEFTVPNPRAFNGEVHVKPLTSGSSLTIMAFAQQSSTSPKPRPLSMARMSPGQSNQVTQTQKQLLCITWHWTRPQQMHTSSLTSKTASFAPSQRQNSYGQSWQLQERWAWSHGIQIGVTLKYLLRGTPFEVMKVKGWWVSGAFLVYLTKCAQILVSYMQAIPEVHENFIWITMPQLQR